MTMDKAFLAAYSLRLIATCHRRGAFAMGGMAAFIPVKGDEAANEAAFAKVRADKLREVGNGHDGTWVAHPGAGRRSRWRRSRRCRPEPARRRSPERRPRPRRHAASCTRAPRTEAGVRENIRVGVQYLAAWLGGQGAVPLYNLMEDAATAEICRAQFWQWLRFEAPLDDGRALHPRPVRAAVRRGSRPARRSAAHRGGARACSHNMVVAEDFEEFLTLPAYELLD